MPEVHNMLMIGGNSRHAGKTTLACRVISKLAVKFEVMALKVTSIRPGESELHGDHGEEDFSGFSIIEETDTHSEKDTSLMLQAGANRVFYVRADEDCVEQAITEFLNRYNSGQPIICESRNLRKFIKPGLFLMMMRLPAFGTEKVVAQYLDQPDSLLYYSEDQTDILKNVEKISFKDQKFIIG